MSTKIRIAEYPSFIAENKKRSIRSDVEATTTERFLRLALLGQGNNTYMLQDRRSKLLLC
ncbi:hypothetical protein H6802_01400 [Candidatus Nomurabacteria bacterium]|uniref:Uncharacterized protein n=1 Tax=candidate division WWE3 bacterium TaxID=2053526 RepID=A0A955E0B2_UNCKA|nr:hypothetical protein [candidate division WWE3 bacterium]MCB9823592.1 hypothetical protein [Candidatus Nomurabacteria bacterium]MCB9827387.1 hypothetical protein [Candidatus Nomurabacteria bacterium]HXK52732.1 hypothetical protein [bacterium]